MDISTLAASPTTASSSQTSSAFSQLTDNFDTFLTLLTTQLRNQDPLEPLDTEQFTQQLVQFAGVEQSIQTKSNLETLINLQANSQREQSFDLIGRVVTIDSDQTQFNSERRDRETRWQYTVPDGATALSLQVVDQSDSVVATLDGPDTPGRHDLVWDGLNSNGQPVTDGTYRLRARAVLSNVSADTTPSPLAIQTRDIVSSVQFVDDAAQLRVAGQLVTPASVVRVDTAL